MFDFLARKALYVPCAVTSNPGGSGACVPACEYAGSAGEEAARGQRAGGFDDGCSVHGGLGEEGNW